jgi:hypothetical protein
VLVRLLVVLSVFVAIAGGVVGYGSSSRETAIINVALRRLETELRAQLPALDRKLEREAGRRLDSHGEVQLLYANPPKGVSVAEWRAAVEKDQALQRIVHEGPKPPPRHTVTLDQTFNTFTPPAREPTNTRLEHLVEAHTTKTAPR